MLQSSSSIYSSLPTNPKSEIKENPTEIIVHHINLFYSGGLCSICSFFPPNGGDGPFQPPSFPGLVIGGDALGPALQKLLGEPEAGYGRLDRTPILKHKDSII